MINHVEYHEMSSRQREQYDKGREVARIFERDVVNIMSNTAHAQGFIDELVNNHPTLQQKVMEIVMTFIYNMADKPYFDDRNEVSVMRARQIKDLLGEYGNSFPLI